MGKNLKVGKTSMMTYAFEMKTKSFKVTFFLVKVCALSVQARHSKNQYLKNAPCRKIMA